MAACADPAIATATTGAVAMQRLTVNKCVPSLAAILLALNCAGAETAPDGVELSLQREFTPPSLELLESGRLQRAPRSVAPMTVPTPVSRPAPVMASEPTLMGRLPALLLASFFVALAAFAAGIMAGRRGQATARNAAMQLWRDESDVGVELERTRVELAEERERGDDLRAELERVTALHKARAAAATAQGLQLTADGRNKELAEAHETIDALRAELEVLRGAEADLERAKRFEPEDGSVDALHKELERRQDHIRELEVLMHTVRTERDSMAERLLEGEQQLSELGRQLAERDHALQQSQHEVQQWVAQSAAAPSPDRVAELEAELAAARSASADAAGLEQRIAELASEADQAQALRARVAELEQESGAQQRELLSLGESMHAAQHKSQRVEVLELELAARHEEIQALRAEAAASGAETTAGFEEEFAASQLYARELEDRAEHLQARVHVLEQALRRDEDDTTRLELGSFDANDLPTPEKQALSRALDKAEERILDLEHELESAREEIGLINRDPVAADLHSENIRLSAIVVQREHAISELEARLEAIESKEQRLGEWTTTVSSLENELRRKTSLLDATADELRADEERVANLDNELESLRTRLAASEQESESLREMLEKSKLSAAALRMQMHQTDDETIRMRLERDPGEIPRAPSERGLGPMLADIETLRFTLDSRRDLATSLETILAEENIALTTANERVAAREEHVVELENEIAANRVTIAAMQNRLRQMRAQSAAATPVAATEKLEHELQRNMRASEKLRVDLLTWRRRVKPLHEAVVLRDGRIRSLESELTVLRAAKLETLVRPTAAPSGARCDDAAERVECLEQIESLHGEIERHEQALAEVGTLLSRALAAEESALGEIEDLEAARAAQLIRIDELYHELESSGAVESEEIATMAELRTPQPS